jgi:hypothetical protein
MARSIPGTNRRRRRANGRWVMLPFYRDACQF